METNLYMSRNWLTSLLYLILFFFHNLFFSVQSENKKKKRENEKSVFKNAVMLSYYHLSSIWVAHECSQCQIEASIVCLPQQGCRKQCTTQLSQLNQECRRREGANDRGGVPVSLLSHQNTFTCITSRYTDQLLSTHQRLHEAGCVCGLVLLGGSAATRWWFTSVAAQGTDVHPTCTANSRHSGHIDKKITCS